MQVLFSSRQTNLFEQFANPHFKVGEDCQKRLISINNYTANRPTKQLLTEIIIRKTTKIMPNKRVLNIPAN
ncbi:MAG: hypothetical protein ABIC82_03585 [bacterium]